ncbi:MAG: hypothetical protein JWO67_2441 [Streptosporangiaceae bacterium]|nr:hypothetical protein [Streptosporangiaceae bacterium]
MPGQPKFELSVTQLIASAAATVTATVAASYFGVGGTLIGAGAVSVLSTVGATIYRHFLDRGREQIVAKIPARAPAAGSRGAVGAGGEDGDSDAPAAIGTAAGSMGSRPWPKWYVLTGAAAGVFLVVIGLVTVFELSTGRPLANTVQGKAGQGTSVHPVLPGVRPTPGPPASGEATPAATPTPSTPTPELTPQTTPTPYPSGTSDPSPSQGSFPTGVPTGPIGTRSPAPQPPPPLGGTPGGNTGASHSP